MAIVASHRGRWLRGAGIAAGVAALVTWSLLPIYWIVSTALKQERAIYAYPPTLLPSEPTLANFATILTATRFPRFLANSLMVALAATAAAVIVGTLAAYAVTRMRFAGRAAVARAVVASYLLPPALLFIPLFAVLLRLGLIDSLIGLTLAHLTFTVPFATWMLIGYLRTVPIELDEAARIDGAGRLTVLWRVLVPVALPGVAVVALYAFTHSWNEFLYALIFVYSEGSRTLTAGLVGLMMGDVFIWGQLMAASAIAIAPMLMIYVLGQRYLVEGLTGGSVK